MCTRSKQTNVILVILFFILFQLLSWVVFSTFNQPEEEQEGSMPSEKRSQYSVELFENRSIRLDVARCGSMKLNKAAIRLDKAPIAFDVSCHSMNPNKPIIYCLLSRPNSQP